jgi:hypothetical protein
MILRFPQVNALFLTFLTRSAYNVLPLRRVCAPCSHVLARGHDEPEQGRTGMAEARRSLRLIGVAAAAFTAVGITVSTAQADEPSTVQPKIIGGEETTIEENPFVVALTTPDGFQFCGGTIVAPTKVLTAAHCTDGQEPSDIRVVAGRTNLKTDGGTTAGVTGIWIHPDWNSSALTSDSSVLTLDTSLTEEPLELASPSDEDLYAAGANSTVLTRAPSPTRTSSTRRRWCARASPRVARTAARATRVGRWWVRGRTAPGS